MLTIRLGGKRAARGACTVFVSREQYHRLRRLARSMTHAPRSSTLRGASGKAAASPGGKHALGWLTLVWRPIGGRAGGGGPASAAAAIKAPAGGSAIAPASADRVRRRHAKALPLRAPDPSLSARTQSGAANAPTAAAGGGASAEKARRQPMVDKGAHDRTLRSAARSK